jgi:hypothetical protein
VEGRKRERERENLEGGKDFPSETFPTFLADANNRPKDALALRAPPCPRASSPGKGGSTREKQQRRRTAPRQHLRPEY